MKSRALRWIGAMTGLQNIAMSDTASASLRGSLNVTAVAGAYPVASFGAKGDGQTDDTAAIQRAINAAHAAGGGSVVFSVARYFTTGRFVLPQGVVLCGAIEGPFDPSLSALAPTLLITNTRGPFLSLQGVGAGVTDLLFHYPNQVASSAAAPAVFPYTIVMTAPGTEVARSTVTNAYNFLDIEVGRTMAQDLFIGALHIAVNIDHALDRVTLRHLVHSVFWDVWEGASFPQPIDTWVLKHGTALMIGRADSLEVSDFLVFSRFTGMQPAVGRQGGSGAGESWRFPAAENQDQWDPAGRISTADHRPVCAARPGYDRSLP